MTKSFCDNCTKEITKLNPNIIADRVEFNMNRHKFQVMVATNDTWNQGDLCLTCARKLIVEAMRP